MFGSSADKRAARVYVTVAGDEKEHKEALAALRHAAPYVRKQLGLSLNLPRIPEIHFVRDRVEEEGERVDQLLQQIEREWERKERMNFGLNWISDFVFVRSAGGYGLSNSSLDRLQLNHRNPKFEFRNSFKCLVK